MEFQFKGANCVQIQTKSGSIITDPALSELGVKEPNVAKFDVCLLTDSNARPQNVGEAFVVDSPGEYEVKGYSVKGISAKAHVADETHSDLRTIYRVSNSDMHVLICGHIYPEFTDAQLETIGMIDVMVVPIGGNGYTLDAVGAMKLIKMVDPKIVIPTHFEDSGLQYTVPQASLETFIKEIGAPHEHLDKLKIKKDTLEENLKIISLQRV